MEAFWLEAEHRQRLVHNDLEGQAQSRDDSAPLNQLFPILEEQEEQPQPQEEQEVSTTCSCTSTPQQAPKPQLPSPSTPEVAAPPADHRSRSLHTSVRLVYVYYHPDGRPRARVWYEFAHPWRIYAHGEFIVENNERWSLAGESLANLTPVNDRDHGRWLGQEVSEKPWRQKHMPIYEHKCAASGEDIWSLVWS